MNALSRIVQITALLLGVWGCSSDRAGSTSSKIKIIGANAFSGSLGAAANNGLLLYGRSLDGKSFTKKINSDVLDLNFPNGTWNFYAVAWEHGAPDATTGLKGKVSCAKSLGVQLKGVEVAINLKLNNNNCDSNFHPNVEFVSGEYKLANLSLVSCKNVSLANYFVPSGVTVCDQNTGNLHKGYATSFKIVVPEYNSVSGGIGPGITSECLVVHDGASAFLDSASIAKALDFNLPKIGLNGLKAYVKVYYSLSPCDESSLGFSTISLSESVKNKHFTSAPLGGSQITDQFFLEADASIICQDQRPDQTFASGRGSFDIPYTICSKQQFLNIETNYSSGLVTRTKSFDLLKNIDFQFQIISSTGGDGTLPYTGAFNGLNHRIENFRIDCDGLGDSDNYGLFRYASSGATFSNLVLNRAVVECFISGQINHNIGLLLGHGANIQLNNILGFGHIEGKQKVGGLVGQFTLNSHASDVHFEGDIKGEKYVGGIIGYATGTSDSTPFVFQSSFSGSLRGKCPSMSNCDSILGGLVGEANYSSLGKISESTAKIKSAEGSLIIGGVAGKTNKIEITESIVSGFLISNAVTTTYPNVVQMGGLVGFADFGNFNKNVAYVTRKTKGTDIYEGGIIGKTIYSPTCVSVTPNKNYALASLYSTDCNNFSSMTLNQITDKSNYFSSDFATEHPHWIWNSVDSGVGKDIPRLLWEIYRENSVPHLKRKCSGLYDSQSGDGSQFNPKSICSVSQYDLMLPGVYYSLKKDLLFDAVTPVTQKPSGHYFLNGENNALINPYIEASTAGGQGLFKNLASLSEIKNLNIYNAKIGGMLSVPGNVNMGILAGSNSGSIFNVNIYDSAINLEDLDFSGDSHVFTAGSIVGINDLSGKISNLELDSDINLYRPYTDGDDYFYMASVVGKNFGDIKIVKSSGSVNRKMGSTFNASNFDGSVSSLCITLGEYRLNIFDSLYYLCTGTNFTQEVSPLKAEDNFAGVVAYNTGSLSEIDFEGDMEIRDVPSNALGILAPFVGTNNGSISDVHIQSRMNLVSRVVNKLIPVNSGAVSRLYFNTEDTSTDFSFSSLDSFFTGVSDSPGICHSVSSSFCTYNGINFINIDPVFDLGGKTYSTWSFTDNFFAPSNTTWLLEDDELSLRRTGGSFEKLGKGF